MSVAPFTSPVSSPADRSLVRLLDRDLDLARHFSAAELPAAAAAVTVAARQAAPGAWTPPANRPQGMLGFLLLEGSILRHVEVADRVCAHLIGPGDIFDPWMQIEAGNCGPATYRIVESAQLVILNSRFVRNAAPYPQILAAVMERLIRQQEQMAGLYALALLPRVDTRLLAFFWHLAQRWGRVGRDGVIIPLDLTHRTLGELVGGRRPTISVALTELDQAGLLRRRQDGGWELARESWKLLADTPCPVDPAPVLAQA